MLNSSLIQWLRPHRSVLAAGFSVGRVLPFHGGRGVGPFVFLDHMGPHTFALGEGLDIASHPHIGLSTVTYLFEGEIGHRDTLGTHKVIRPGDVNWMTAGKGIAHSERTPPENRLSAQSVHGIQAWVALPSEYEEVEPNFEHFERDALPVFEIEGAKLTLIAGTAYGKVAPVRTYSRLFYLAVEIDKARYLRYGADSQEVAFYLISGSLSFEGKIYQGPGLLHFVPGSEIELLANSDCVGMLLGGEAFPERRKIWWNFVSSRPERIELAKKQWKDQAFGRIAEETEFIPLP